MLRINLSRMTKLAALAGGLSLLALPYAQAEEPHPPMPLLLEEGGNLNYFDPATMTLNIQGQGRSYRIDPTNTRVVIISAQRQVTELPAGQLADLAQRLERFRGRALSFQSFPDGRLKLLVLDEAYATSPSTP